MRAVTITITKADNDAAIESQAATPEGSYWDITSDCPVAQALNRQFPEVVWLVNRSGARPRGAHRYWFTLSQPLVQALDEFDQSIKHGLPIPIIGPYEIYEISRRDRKTDS